MLIDGRYETLEEKNLYVTGEILRILSEIPPYRSFQFYETYYNRISRLCWWFMHLKAKCFLTSGRLLNAVRDGGVGLSLPYGLCFSVVGISDFGKIWEYVHTYVNDDPLLEWDVSGKKYSDTYTPQWFSSNYTDKSGSYVSLESHSLETSNIMQFNLTLKGFPEFPLQQIEFLRYQYNSDLNMFVNAYSPHDEVYFLEPEYLRITDSVNLYGSPFLTIGREYFVSYFERRFGANWDIPIHDLEYIKKAFDESYHR